MSWRSIASVIVGATSLVVVTTLVDIALHLLGVYTQHEPLTHPLAALATFYRVVIGVAAGWLTARLAPARPMTHALVLGAIGVALGLIGLVATWDLGLGPRWYPVALVILAVPQCWAGARIFQMQSGRTGGRA